MKWTICILTVPERSIDLKRIKGILEYQIGDRRDIELLVNDGPEDVGAKRQKCLDDAAGEYICFIDDDDLVSYKYIDTIYPLLDGVDYVGFRMQLYEDGKKTKPTFHSLRYKKWFDDARGYYRDISHLNPIKTSIARQASFYGTYAEDFNWAQQLSGIPKTEHFIDEPMYFYFHSYKYSITEGT